MFFLLACARVEIDQLDAIFSGLIFSKPELDSCLRQLFNAHCIASASRLGRFDLGGKTPAKFTRPQSDPPSAMTRALKQRPDLHHHDLIAKLMAGWSTAGSGTPSSR